MAPEAGILTTNSAENTFKLQAVEEQTADLLATIRHILNDVQEARRLRRLKDSSLDAGERKWMDGVIIDTDSTAREVALLLEPSRVDLQTRKGSISLRTRLLWVMRDSHKLKDKYARLTVCHQSLVSAITTLHARPAPVESVSTTITDADTLRSPIRNSSIWAAEVEKKMGIRAPPPSYNLTDMLAWRKSRHISGGVDDNSLATLAELPGSSTGDEHSTTSKRP